MAACRRFKGLCAWSRRGAAAHRGGLHRRADGADVRHRRARQLAAGEEAKVCSSQGREGGVTPSRSLSSEGREGDFLCRYGLSNEGREGGFMPARGEAMTAGKVASCLPGPRL